MAYQNAFIIGATGNIGRTLVSQIYDCKDTSRLMHENPTKVVGLACRTKMRYNVNGFSKPEAIVFRGKKDSTGNGSLETLMEVISQPREERIIFMWL